MAAAPTAAKTLCTSPVRRKASSLPSVGYLGRRKKEGWANQGGRDLLLLVNRCHHFSFNTGSVYIQSIHIYILFVFVFFDLCPASTPSEDSASGDAMGISKTGTLGPADKDRRSKKKCVNHFPCFVHYQIKVAICNFSTLLLLAFPNGIIFGATVKNTTVLSFFLRA